MNKSFWILAMVGLGCGGGSSGRPALPERPAGCEVELSYGSPRGNTQNLGLVSATCAEDVEEKACLRELQDQVCKLGGDIVWGVSEKPERVGEKNKYTGRAAVTKQ